MRYKKLSNSIFVLCLVVWAFGIYACSPAPDGVSIVDSPKLLEIAQPVPDWQQVNSNGFGDPQAGEVSALEAFNGYLYAGTSNPTSGARIFRSPDGTTWTPVTDPGFGNPHDTIPPAILDMMVFKGYIYASTGRGNASQVWRSFNGVIWAPMNVTGFGDPENVDLTALAEFGGRLYAGVTNQGGGAQIWSSLSGDNNTWTRVGPAVGGAIPATITSFAVFDFDGGLYAAVEFESDLPVQIWRSYGGAWDVIVSDGFGDANTLSTGGMAVFGGYLYVGAGSTAEGAQLWRTHDGAAWEQVIAPAFGDPNNQRAEMVYVFQNELYVSVKNTATGMEIWRTTDGVLWEQTNLDGFGDINNTGTNRSNATADFMSQLYVGTSNSVDGGELWLKLQQLTPTSTATSTNTSTFTPTSTPSNTATHTSTFTATSTLTYTPTGTMTITPSTTPTSTPTNTPTPIPYPNIPGRVTGGGNIDTPNKKVTFGFEVQFDIGDENPSGNLTFKDHTIKLDLKASSFTELYMDDDNIRISGYATVNGISNLSFTLDIFLQEEPDNRNMIMIKIPEMNDYSFVGSLSGGSIKIKSMK